MESSERRDRDRPDVLVRIVEVVNEVGDGDRTDGGQDPRQLLALFSSESLRRTERDQEGTQRAGTILRQSIAGSFVAKYLGEALHWYSPGETAGFIASVVGAIILLFIYHLATRNSAA